MPGFLDDLRGAVKHGSFRPLPVRPRKIPKPGGSGKVRSLGIPTIADRVVQATPKLVLEPIFEADFVSVSYGLRPNRRPHDAIAEIHQFGTHGYRWVLDADTEAFFDRIDHTALMGRVRGRITDKRVLALVKAFLKAGILAELGEHEDTHTGTPQGGSLLLANIALSVLDEHVHGPWRPGGEQSTAGHRARRRAKGLPNWRIVRYADDLAVLVHGAEADVANLRGGNRPRAGHRGVALLRGQDPGGSHGRRVRLPGFHIQWHCKRASDKWHVYTFIADRPVRSMTATIRAVTTRTSAQDPGAG